MKSLLRKLIIASSLLCASKSQASTNDVTAYVENLGNPFTAKPTYARNVWDMQVFNGRLYFGHGNASNLNPSPNAGPINVPCEQPGDIGQYRATDLFSI
jgi:hypothetical protein